MSLIAQRGVLQLAVLGVLGTVATSTLSNDQSPTGSDDGYDSGYASSSSSSDDDAFYDNMEVWISCAWASATPEHLNSKHTITVTFSGKDTRQVELPQFYSLRTVFMSIHLSEAFVIFLENATSIKFLALQKSEHPREFRISGEPEVRSTWRFQER